VDLRPVSNRPQQAEVRERETDTSMQEGAGAAHLREQPAKCRRLASPLVHDAAVAALRKMADDYEAEANQLDPPQVALEAGPLSQWMHAGLTGVGFETVLLETRHVKASISAMQ
jgi:hypothetical protein